MTERRTYTKRFKEEAIQLTSETSVAKAASSLRISEYTYGGVRGRPLD